MKKKALALVMAMSLAVAMTACGSTASTDASESSETEVATEATEATVTTEASTADEGAGFTEIPIFEDEELSFINLSAVYFQPVPMAPGQEDISAFNLHLEADISALENDLGYGEGDWIPYLTVEYSIAKQDGTEVASGTFMEMSASDGPHYGANVALPESDTYNLTITIHSPAENGYLIHSDSETGPGGLLEDYFADGNLSYTFEGWDYTVQEW